MTSGMKKGDVILVADSDELRSKIAQLRQTLAAAQIVSVARRPPIRASPRSMPMT